MPVCFLAVSLPFLHNYLLSPCAFRALPRNWRTSAAPFVAHKAWLGLISMDGEIFACNSSCPIGALGFFSEKPDPFFV